jgi:hypothetical protein
MAGNMWWSKNVHLMAARKQREKGKGPEQNKPFKGTPPVTSLQLGPTF